MITAKPALSDQYLNSLYPVSIQEHARLHWTPLPVARKAALFLAGTDQSIVLDIGSGVGKFCLGAAAYAPDTYFFGVEQRKELVEHANAAKKELRINNVTFLHANFTQINLAMFDHFYFYNAFYENLSSADKIDDTIAYSSELYRYYTAYLYTELRKKPSGTRLCTLCGSEDQIPPEFQEIGSFMDDLLKFWIKL
ncbi:MAG TPA: methyltransferase domain-containing protein [Dinghuibacter sp.]|jgi:SAM-dependent methyltransferase|uniref:methyltransferase domain-containing protein n=1 Tax=Dinghuibacter sp. TaxID=2024697 RepID=UPI002CBB73F2|nr:methyltransferase domain-containing protein [Dinghuibacter sp.]HTJ14344.1 methyltransferase domain-containing protein [Dinghuibacter sp.]